MAKAITDDKLFDLPLSSLFWDLIFGKKTNVFDIDRLQKETFKTFAELQQMANKKKEIDILKIFDPEVKKRSLASIRTSYGGKLDDMWLYFTMPGNESYELKPNGKSILVTLDNLQEYIDLAIGALLHDSVKI